MLRLALAGSTNESELLIKLLSDVQTVTLCAVFPHQPHAGSLRKYCEQYDIPTVAHFGDLLKYAPDCIFLCSPHCHIDNPASLHYPKVVEYEIVQLLYSILSPLYQRLLHSEEKTVKYVSALNAASEGVQILNENGVIEYVNPAFSKITGVHPSERIGTNIREVSPDGAGIQVLENKKLAIGIRNQALGSCADVISNGAPIFINNTLSGAVVIFQEVTDILRLSDELHKSKAIIESLNSELRNAKPNKYTFNDMIGTNKKLLEAINLSKRAAEGDSTILITGESGTGKEILANAIHHASPRWNQPFIAVNCASIPDSLIESELFGHEKGAFTGADKTKIGKFELATGGTLFLDEIGDLNFNVQAKLLRVLQEKEIERLGSNKRYAVDIKIVAATNKKLYEMVQKGVFREDLYYRLQVITVSLPPLRERKDDIPALVNFISRKIARRLCKPVPEITGESLGVLTSYSWPGNIRELENVLTRAIMLSDGKPITPDKFQFIFHTPAGKLLQTDESIIPLDELEKRMITLALKKHGRTTSGKKSAAKSLHISLSTLYNKMKTYKLD